MCLPPSIDNSSPKQTPEEEEEVVILFLFKYKRACTTQSYKAKNYYHKHQPANKETKQPSKNQ
jgi:hypothetical protein